MNSRRKWSCLYINGLVYQRSCTIILFTHFCGLYTSLRQHSQKGDTIFFVRVKKYSSVNFPPSACWFPIPLPIQYFKIITRLVGERKSSSWDNRSSDTFLNLEVKKCFSLPASLVTEEILEPMLSKLLMLSILKKFTRRDWRSQELLWAWKKGRHIYCAIKVIGWLYMSLLHKR